MVKSNFVNMCDKIAMILLCVIMFDSSIFGAGEMLAIGPIGYRQILILVLGMVSIPVMLSRWQDLIKNKFIWMIAIFAAWTAISMIIGLKNGHRVEVMMLDINGFIYFAYLPIVLCIISSRERVHQLMKCVIAGSAVLAVIAILQLIIYLYNPGLSKVLIKYGYEVFFSRIGGISQKIPRLYFISGLYMIGGCAFSIYFDVTQKKGKHRWLYRAVTGTNIFALILSYTRSVYLAMAIAAVVTVISITFIDIKHDFKNIIKHIAVAGAVFSIFTAMFSLIANTNYLQYIFSRSSVGITDMPSEEDYENMTEEEKEQLDYNKETLASDERREITLKEVWVNIRKSPIIGIGAGSVLPSRPDGNEYFYLDIWSEEGIIGLIMYFLPFLWCIVCIIKTKENDICNRQEKLVWLAFLLGIMAYSCFNPYINSSLGIFIYCCVMAISSNKDKNKIVD